MTQALPPAGEGPLDAAADVIIIGAGHNGLTCAAYLARAGLAVTVLEARSVLGGCAATEQALGAKVNLCNCDHSLVMANPLLAELGLARHGLDYLEVDPNLAGIGWGDEPPLFIFRNIDRTLASLALTHPGSVDGYRRYLRAAIPAARLLVAISNRPPSSRSIAGEIARHGGRGGRTLLAWRGRSLIDVMSRFFDDERVVRPLAVTTTGVWGQSPGAPRTGWAALSYAARHLVGVFRPRGGSGMLGEALRAVAEEAGARIQPDARVTAIGGGERVRRIRLADGSELSAPLVVSALCPRKTILELVGDDPTPGFSRLRRDLLARTELDGYQSKLDAVVGQLPELAVFDRRLLDRLEIGQPLIPSVAIAPDLDRIEEIERLRQAGRIAEQPMMVLNVPSALDPSMTAPDGHVLSLEVLFTPYRLEGGWKESTPLDWLRAFGSIAGTGFAEGVLRWRAMTPVDYERELGLTKGNPPAFSGGPLDVLTGRRRAFTRYATPWPGLYLTGAGTYPGGGVWGAAGRNAALKVLRDRR